MGINLDSNAINKGLEIAKNLSQVSANLTKPQPKPQPEKPKQENLNQPHTQTVEVKVGEQTPNPKPVVVKEKTETHVHNHFPENRELNDKECAVRELELKQDHEYKLKELEYRARCDEEDRKERREREARAEKERQRREERNRKASRRAAFCLGTFGVLAVGAFAYGVYSDYRNAKNSRLALPEQKVIPVEGDVK